MIDPEPFEVSEARIKYGDSSWEGFKKEPMLIHYMALLQRFHWKFDHVIHEKPTIPSEDTMELRKKLIAEETHELFKAINDEDLIQIAKELADVLYVVFGTAVSYGLPMDEVFYEVHQANMTKSPSKNSIGKTKKGDDYKAPDIEAVFRAKFQPEKGKNKK